MADTEIRKLHDATTTETMKAVYTTGMIDIANKMDRPRQIRRINLHYESKTNIICRVYADGYTDGNQVCSVVFPANVDDSGPRFRSMRPTGGARAKSIVIKLETNEVFGLGTIRKLELEFDE